MRSANSFEADRAAAIHHLRERGVSNFWDLCRLARGTDPIFVANELGHLPAAGETQLGLREAGPDESPGRAEWYFTDETSKEVAGLLPGKLLCLGVPTLATARETGVLLVDDSPWLTERFDFHHNEWDRSDISEVSIGDEFDSAILDPPWYGDNLHDWLQFASGHVRAGGVIAVPLMGENTRPSASQDRDRIMSAASQMGALELRREIVRYEVPAFERYAFVNAGFGSVEPWRLADLLLVRNELPTQQPRRPVGESDWFDFRLGRQIISIRKTAASNTAPSSTPFVSPVVGYDDYLLKSVSRRDPKLQNATFWTSRSTVGEVRDCARFTHFLRRCSEASLGTRGLDSHEVELASRIGIELVLEES